MPALVVLHLLPTDVARGAQTYAAYLRAALDEPAVHHRTATLFAPTQETQGADLTLGVPSGFMRKSGLDVRAVLRLRHLLGEMGPAVVVAHGGEPLKYAVAAGATHDQLVYYKVGANNARLTGLRRALHARLVRRCRIVAAVSNAAADEVEALGVPRNAIAVIPNGRDPEVYRPPAVPRVGDPVRLVWIGRLDAPKRPAVFLDLVKRLRTRGCAVTAALAGDGPLVEALASDARAACVELLGLIDDVPDLLRRSDILVLTSLPMEGMPGVLIEAGLSGLPVVTTDVPGAADVVENRETGFVVATNDVDDLVEATHALVVDADLRRVMGAAARERCARAFSLAHSAQQWRALIDSILDLQR